jgi:hypothetical protein
MSVKQVENIPKKETDVKMERLKADIREIIEKRYRFAEITDTGYADSNMRDRIYTAIRKVLQDIRRERGTRHIPEWAGLPDVQMRTEDGVRHWYVVFDPEKWDAEWERIRETEER